MPHAPFVHLRVHTTYSLSEGAIKLNELAALCVKDAMPAVAITDSSNLFGSLEFSQACKNNGVQPIIGCNLAVKYQDGIIDHLLVLAKDETGYKHLLKLASLCFLNEAGESGEKPHITFGDLQGKTQGLIALVGSPECIVGRLLAEQQQKEADTWVKTFQSLFPDCLYLELMRHGEAKEEQIEPYLFAFADTYNIPLVATNNVYFASEDMFEAHDALSCIASGRYVLEDDRPKLNKEYYFKSARSMEKLFEDVPEAIANTLVIAQRCAVMSPTLDPILPHFPTKDGRDEGEELRFIARNGLEQRLEEHCYKEGMTDAERQELAKPYQERLEYEIDIIIKMQYPGYFLIVSDFIRWSKGQGIPVGPGRGSGAGSVVAWCLQITDLDPLRFGLLFERFLNPERVSMPDFDIDFCQDRRDEVIHYVQQKYGHDKVAQIITFGKLQARAVLRDVGRVLQMPYGQVDKICKLVPNNPASPVTLQEAIDIEPQLRDARAEDEDVKKLIDIGLKLEGLNRHASTHAAGVVIADRPLDELVALYQDPRSVMQVVQYSMKYAEMAGLVKFDFLGLKTLTVIDRACKLVKEKDIELDMSKVPLEDPATFEMLTKGDSVGVFQLESAGMRDTLRKLKPDTFDDIIALISLYRPGPMDNIPSYIARKHGNEIPDYLHPMLEDVLKETFGVIIYQEQVMEIAKILSGYSLGEADLLRRAMGKKIKAEMDKQREAFVEGAKKNNVTQKQASSIFDLVAKFAGYGFNKSHAAGYALISYQTAYLKANHPVEFLVASMNLDINDTDKIHVFCQDARRLGIKVLDPDINHSRAVFAVEKLEDGELAIRYGLGALKNVGIQAMEECVAERKANGPFADLFDMASRVGNKVMNKRQLENLAKAGAFDALHANRRQIVEGVDILTRFSSVAAQERSSNQMSLFGEAQEIQVAKPQLPDVEDWPLLDRVQGAFEAVGFYLAAHPLDEYASTLERMGIIDAMDITTKVSKGVSFVKLAGVVTQNRVRMSKRGRFAYTQLSDPTGSFEVAIFDETLLEQSKDLLEKGTPVVIHAEARKDEGSLRLNASKLKLVDEYIQQQPLIFRITIDQLETVTALEAMFKDKGKGKARVLVNVVCQGKEVEINLPDGYALTPVAKDSIGKVPGVLAVQTV